MQAAILYDYNTPLVVENLDLNEPAEGEVLVKIKAAGICHSDWHAIKGDWPWVNLPIIPGHEVSGIAEEVGENVLTLKPGDHVILTWKPGCGECEMCIKGHPAVCDKMPVTSALPKIRGSGNNINKLVGLGGFGTYTVIPEHAAVLVDKDVPFPQKALVGCAVTTGVGSVINTAKVIPGSSVAVFGCGGVGLNCIQGANIAGATTIIAVDLLNDKLEMAKQFGATHVINASKENPVEIIREFTDGEGVHYAFEAIGVAALPMVQSVECTRKRGITVWVGAPPSNMPVTLDARDLVLEKSIIGSYYGSSQPHLDFSRILRLYKKGKLQLDQLISKTYPLEKINDAFEALSKGEVARSVIIFD